MKKKIFCDKSELKIKIKKKRVKKIKKLFLKYLYCLSFNMIYRVIKLVTTRNKSGKKAPVKSAKGVK